MVIPIGNMNHAGLGILTNGQIDGKEIIRHQESQSGKQRWRRLAGIELLTTDGGRFQPVEAFSQIR